MIRTHWRTIACALLACVAATPAAAQRVTLGGQRVTLNGQVVDADGRPVAAAVVEVMPRHESASTDAQGRFRVRTTLGDHVIMADALGYHSVLLPVTLGDDTVEVQVTLEKDPVMLQGIVATASRLQSRRRSYPYAVHSLSAAQIVTSGAPNMELLVQERLGVYFTSCSGYSSAGALASRSRFDPFSSGGFHGCVYSRGSTIPSRVYVDEVRMPDSGALSLYHPEDVAEVEVYHNGEQIRVYTRWFMEWAARNNSSPLPRAVASF
jgi:hypothetical protein